MRHVSVRRARLGALTAVLLVLAPGATQGGDVEKKWRVGLAIGGYNPNSEVESASANEMFTLNPCIRSLTCEPGAEQVVRGFRDPRSDAGAFGKLDMQGAPLGTLSVQYGITKTFIVEASVGYEKADVGDVEVAAQLPGLPSSDPEQIPFNFQLVRLPVGEIERVPIQLSGLYRFRPRATFNPYVGAGIGYSIIGFDVDPAFDELSRNMDASRGTQMRVGPFFAFGSLTGQGLSTDGLPALDLSGATVDARDTFEWHLALGADITIKKRWSAFVDVRWVDASRELAIGFNGGDELGASVPDFSPYDDTPMANGRYGPNAIGSCAPDNTGGHDQNGQAVRCTGGGLLDLGHLTLVPSDTAPPNTDCVNNIADIQSSNCQLRFVRDEGDGVNDPGQYYAQGGDVQYDGWSAQFGVRFTF